MIPRRPKTTLMKTRTSFKRGEIIALEANGKQDLAKTDEQVGDAVITGRGQEIVEAPEARPQPLKIDEGLPALGSNFIFLSAKERQRARRVRLACYTFIPAALAVLWSILFVSPLYSSEAHFAVKAEAAAASSGMTDISKGASMQGMLGGIVDGYAVRDFLTSREAFNLLRKKVAYEKLMRVGSESIFAPILRALGLKGRDPPFDTFQSNVKCRFNITEQAVILDVYAYGPGDAQQIAGHLVAMAEDFADRMNQRARQDWTQVMEREVHAAERDLAKVRTKLTQWRNKNATVDPSANAASINEQIRKLEETLTGARTTYGQLIAISGQSPRKVALENTIRILTSQVAEARGRLGGINGDKEFAQTIGDYEALKVEQDSAEKHLQTVRDTYEVARVDSIKHQRYINAALSPSIEPMIAFPQYYLVGIAGAGIGLTIMAVLSLLSTIQVDGHRKHRGRSAAERARS